VSLKFDGFVALTHIADHVGHEAVIYNVTEHD
jgi:hypothetical protein